MSTYEEQYHSSDVICPYCGYTYQLEGEDTSEDVVEIECDDCGKKFHQSCSFSITVSSAPDCELNGQTHLFRDYGSECVECEVCGFVKLAEAER